MRPPGIVETNPSERDPTRQDHRLPPAENALQLDSLTIIGFAVANVQGVATLQRFIPAAAQGKTILLQTVAPSQCAISQLMLTTVE